MENKEMENPKEEKQTPNTQTTKPKTTEMEKPKEKKQSPNDPQTTKPKSIEIMEKPKEKKQTQNLKTKTNLEKLDQLNTTKHVVWDCESSLYDSFELKSFEKQLDLAISARTMSMPHLSDHHRKPPPPPPSQQKPTSKKTSRISRSLQKFIRSVFRPKQNNNSIINNNKNSKSSSWFRVEKGSREGVYYVYDTSGALTTIPEVPENTVGDFDGLSPDLKSFVRRTASDRFAPAASVGISCA